MSTRGVALEAPAVGQADLPTLGLFALLVFGTIAQGGFYPAQAWVLAAAAAAVAFVAVRDGERSASFSNGLFAGAVLFAGMAISSIINGASSWTSFATLIIAIAGLTTMTQLDRTRTRMVLQAMTVAGVIAAATGFFGILFHVYPLAIHQFHLWRASGTLTYPNAAALLYTLSAGASLVIARDERRSVFAKLAFWLLVVATIVTFSRGALIAAVISIIVLVVAGGGSLLRPMLRPIVAAVVTVVSFVPSVTHDAMHPAPALIGLALGIAIVLAPSVRSRTLQIVAASIGIAILAIVAVPLLHKSGRIFDSRLHASTGNRAFYWSSATHSLKGHLAFGRGPGNMRATTIYKGRPINFKFAHDEALQILAETGIVGLAAVLGAGAFLALWAYRRRPPARSAERATWAIALAACSAFVVHAAFDFVWHIPVLALAAFLWLGIAVTGNDISSQREGA